MSRSVSLIKGKNNMIGISIGGGAPLCPVLYVVQVSGTRISPTRWPLLCMSSVCCLPPSSSSSPSIPSSFLLLPLFHLFHLRYSTELLPMRMVPSVQVMN